MYRHRRVATAITLVLLAVVLAAAARRGARGRVVLPAPATVTVASPEDAYRIWKDAGVRGRILLLFDRYPHLDLGWQDYRRGAPLTAVNFLDFAVFEDVVRKIWWVVPEEGWEEFRERAHMYHPIRQVLGADRATYVLVNDNSGISLVAAAPSSLPRFDEPVLVYLNGATFDPAEAARVLTARGVSSDLTVVLEEAPR